MHAIVVVSMTASDLRVERSILLQKPPDDVFMLAARGEVNGQAAALLLLPCEEGHVAKFRAQRTLSFLFAQFVVYLLEFEFILGHLEVAVEASNMKRRTPTSAVVENELRIE